MIPALKILTYCIESLTVCGTPVIDSDTDNSTKAFRTRAANAARISLSEREPKHLSCLPLIRS
jgi:hypothetical protein